MRSPLHGTMRGGGALPTDVLYFHDWRHVQPGHFAWRGPEGESVPMLAPGKVPQPMRYHYIDVPWGVRLRGMAPQKSDPVLSPEEEGMVGISTGTVIEEDGVYRLWHGTWSHDHFERGIAGESNLLCYAESADGIKWKHPNVRDKRFKKHVVRNAVFGGDILYPTPGFHGDGVFRDPHGPKSERYKCVFKGKATKKQTEAYLAERPDDIDPIVMDHFQRRGRADAIFGAVSPDGIRWKLRKKPMLLHFSDTQNVGEWDETLGKYVVHVRTWIRARRAIGRAVGDDFRRLEFPEQVLVPEATEAPACTWYGNGKTRMPDAPDQHVLFPMMWDLRTDRFTIHMMASQDNVNWSWVPDRLMVHTGNPDAFDGGTVGPCPNLVNLPGKRTGLLIAATQPPHKYPRRAPYGCYAWAYWERDRLVALEAPEMGAFSLFPFRTEKRTVRLNVRTALTGYVRVQAVAPNGEPYPGRSFADCDEIIGNHPDRPVTWNGASDIGHAEDEEVVFQFEMRNAELFKLTFA